MATRTFEYCSLEYLNQWILYDSEYCAALTKGTRQEKLDKLRKAASYYRISRNLPLAADRGKGLRRYEPLLDVIDSVEPADFKPNPIPGIRKVEAAISRRYSDRGVLSLTTKVLWLKLKHPIIIYDARARNAIRTKEGDLESYYTEWRAAFNKQKDGIAAACAKLSRMSKYTVDESVATKDYIQKLTKHPWFHERVFDIYLWNKGGNV